MPIHFPPGFEMEDFYHFPFPGPPPLPAAAPEESPALEACRARAHFGENEEGKAERSRMLSLLSCRSTSLGIMITEQSAWLFEEGVSIDGAWLAL